MKRTKEEAEETRRRILEAAMEAFSSKGYGAVSLATIAAKVKVTKGAVYWHFQSKKDLFDCLIREKAGPAMGELEETLHLPVSALQRVRLYMEKYLTLLAEDREYAAIQRILFFHMESSEELKESYDQKRDFLKKLHGFLVGLLDQAREAGEIRYRGDLDLVAFALLSYIYGLANTWLFYPADISIGREAGPLTEIFLRGLA